MKLIIRVSASAITDPSGIGADPSVFPSLHGVASDESFSEYIIDDGSAVLMAAPIEDGTLVVEHDPVENRLWSVVTYSVARRLSPEEEAALVDYTLEQLTDGIGENLAYEYVSRTKIFLVLAEYKREVGVSYE